MPPSEFRERAFLVCQDSQGKLHAGAMVSGTRDNVAFPAHCPTATEPVAVLHTHPDDDSIRPSAQDLAVTARRGLRVVCVGHRGRVKCYRVRK